MTGHTVLHDVDPRATNSVEQPERVVPRRGPSASLEAATADHRAAAALVVDRHPAVGHRDAQRMSRDTAGSSGSASRTDPIRLAAGAVASGPTFLLEPGLSIAGLLPLGSGGLRDAAARTAGDPIPPDARILAPVDRQEVWAAGVTYRRSHEARVEEATEPSVYDRVYAAERPELFFKASPSRVQGPGEPIGVRADSTWNVPEPELVLVVTSTLEIAGYVLGNDVSSRSIEGENPLYLPQAKVYRWSCAIGPALVPADAVSAPDHPRPDDPPRRRRCRSAARPRPAS